MLGEEASGAQGLKHSHANHKINKNNLISRVVCVCVRHRRRVELDDGVVVSVARLESGS